jgi:hypothetical protein
LDLETIAAEPLATLRQQEADALAKAAVAATAPVETIETLSAKLAALQAAQPAAKTA